MPEAGLRIHVKGTGSFLPNAPVSNDEVDAVLGPIDGAPVHVKQLVRAFARKLLHNSGISARHFAVDRVTRRLTHGVAALGEEAARAALDASGARPADVELLLLTSPTYDALTPPTSAMLQERLGIPRCVEMEIHSNCSGFGKCIQIAFDALRVGRHRTALVVAVQHSSAMLRGQYFNAARVTPEQAALRYVLSDGAGAIYLEASRDGQAGGHEILGTFVESVGADRKPGMSAGAGVLDAVQYEDAVRSIYENGSHHLDQDFNAILRDAGTVLLDGAEHMLASLGLRGQDVDHCVVSIPNLQLYEQHLPLFARRLGITREQAPFRGAACGYCGGASLAVNFDHLARSGGVQPGHLVAVLAVESSKWMSGGYVVRW